MKEGRYIGAIWYPYEDIKVFERLKMAWKRRYRTKKEGRQAQKGAKGSKKRV